MIQFCKLYPCLSSVCQFHWSLQEECWSLQLLLHICLFLFSDQLVFASYISKLVYLVHIRLGLYVFLWIDPLITTYCLFLSLVVVFAVKSSLSHITLATPVFFWMCMHAKSLHHVWFLATPWTVAHQPPLPMGIFHTRILEWVPMPSSRGSSQPRDQTRISYVSCIGRQILYHWCYLGSPFFLNSEIHTYIYIYIYIYIYFHLLLLGYWGHYIWNEFLVTVYN